MLDIDKSEALDKTLRILISKGYRPKRGQKKGHKPDEKDPNSLTRLAEVYGISRQAVHRRFHIILSERGKYKWN